MIVIMVIMRAKNDPKLPISVGHTLDLRLRYRVQYISITVDHIIKIFATQMYHNDIFRCFSLFFYKTEHCKY